MRFTIERNEFLKGLTIASRAIGSKSTNPALLCFKLDVTEKGLEITGSNSDIAIWTLIEPVKGDKEILRDLIPGAVLINAFTLIEFTRKGEGDEITIEVIDNTARISVGKLSVNLVCMDGDEYPNISFAQNATPFSLPCSDLIQLVDQTSFAALTKDTRPILTSVNLRAENGTLTATATDSARLSRKFVNVDGDLRFNVNVPAKTMSDVTKLLDPGSEVEVSASTDKITFSFANTIVSSRLIGENYPVSSSIIPTSFNYFLEVNSQQLLSAIDRVSILSQNAVPVVKLSMSEEAVEVSTANQQTGFGSEKLSTFTFNGDSIEIAFNATFVADAVKALGCEDVQISFIGEMKPFVIKNPKDDSVVELITPMRTR